MPQDERYVSEVSVCPGSTTEMHGDAATVQTSRSASSKPSGIVIETGDVAPAIHGATVAGTHGVGVPDAAEVRILHVPKLGMLVPGAKSAIVAAS